MDTSNSKFSDVDEYGFKRAENFDYKSYEKFMSEYLNTLTKRRIKWETLLESNPDFTRLDSKLKRYIRKGIPGPYRPDIWMRISGAHKLQQQSPDLYRTLLSRTHDKKTIDSIGVDIPRTFPDNIYFESKMERLTNVLLAYAQYNREVGYCQGLNYIAGLLLIVTDDEEKSFWLLRHIIENVVPNYHSNNMANFIRDLATFKELIKRRSPRLYRHIESVGLPFAVISSKWLICVFAEVLPVETVLRIWDCMFAEGYKIIFRASLALLLSHKTDIMNCREIAALVNFLRDKMYKDEIVTNCHRFMESMFAIRLTRSELESLRKICVKRADTNI